MTPAGETAARIIADQLTEDQRDTILTMWACSPILSYCDISGQLTDIGLVEGGLLTRAGMTVAALVALADPECTKEAKARAKTQLRRENQTRPDEAPA